MREAVRNSTTVCVLSGANTSCSVAGTSTPSTRNSGGTPAVMCRSEARF